MTLRQVNDRFCDILGYSREELEGNSVLDFTLPDDAGISREVAEGVLTSRTDRAVFEKGYPHRDGRRLFAEVSVGIVRDQRGEPLYLVSQVNDITEKKRAEAELRKINAELEDRVAARTADLRKAFLEMEAFTYSVSHDLGAPLRAIDGFSAMVARDHAEQLHGEGQRLLGLVRKNVNRMSTLIDDLLLFSRTSRQDLRHGRLWMNGIVQSAFEEVTGSAGGDARVDLRLGRFPTPREMPPWSGRCGSTCCRTR
jgi:PAS domain S-box-containing protein